MSALALNDAAFAVLFGSALGLGVCLLVSLAPRWGAVSLSQRIGPYLRDITDPQGITPSSPSAGQIGELWNAFKSRFARLAGGDLSLVRRLRQAGKPVDTTAFRGRQLVWSVGGLFFGAALVVLLVLSGRGSVSLGAVPILAAFAGFFACDFMLTRAANARVARIEEEVPTVLEFLALCLAAGEGILDSLRRVGNAGAGDFSAEIRTVVVSVGTGSSLSESLARLSRSLEIPATSRAIDQLISAIDRGAPLAQVLHAQALDSREQAKRSLIERAGKKEIQMLVPLVFLILPLSVLFAVFPGIFMLRLGIG
ncbi:type II secretion system F family protein [Microbacterium sp. NPDC076911]|uniref:type II secretion system F family protein n=1 Tax=Microbacterium sp. NPDC076911 TaxID=3154958 RepID=UPI003442576F